MKTSKIATIVYENYTENVDMLNPLFNQKELDNLVATDKDIIRVDYYIDGVFVGNKIYTPKQAVAQIRKMNDSIAKIYSKIKYASGDKWLKIQEMNEKLEVKQRELEKKIDMYKIFVTEESYYETGLNCDMCCDYEEFRG